MDGTVRPFNAWLEERGPHLCLMGALDDATGELLEGAHFVAHECSAGYLRVLLGGGPHQAEISVVLGAIAVIDRTIRERPDPNRSK